MALKSVAVVGILALARFAGAQPPRDSAATASPTPSPFQSSTSDSSMVTSDSMNTTDSTNTTIIDTPSMNEPIPKPACDANFTVSIRYSATTGRLYLEGINGTRGGCVTIDQIWEARGGNSSGGAKAPLYAVDPVTGNYSDVMTGTWLLEEDLYVEDGVTLKVRRQQCDDVGGCIIIVLTVVNPGSSGDAASFAVLAVDAFVLCVKILRVTAAW